MLRESEFIDEMWNKIEMVEREEKSELMILEENKRVRNRRIKDYIGVASISIVLILMGMYCDIVATGIASFIAIELVYLYENRNVKNSNVEV